MTTTKQLPMRIARFALATLITCSPVFIGAARAQTPPPPYSPDSWSWRATLYAWLPSVHSKSEFDLNGGGNIESDTNSGNYLSNLKFAAMGTLEARKGPWSFLGDAIYLNFGDVKTHVRSIQGPGGVVVVPVTADIHTELKGFAGAFLGGYSMMRTPTSSLDLVAGVRYLEIKTGLDWTFTGPLGGVPAQGNLSIRRDFWDGVVGVRGRAALTDSWYIPYYADVGGGSSNSTWQAFAGVGYQFGWGDVTLGYRHLSFNFHDDRPLADLTFSGPLLGIGFKF